MPKVKVERKKWPLHQQGFKPKKAPGFAPRGGMRGGGGFRGAPRGGGFRGAPRGAPRGRY